MSTPYQEFARKARERFLERQKKKAAGTGTYQFTLHAQYKMKQYGLSEQRVRSVIRNPKRREVGIVPKTVAVMQPVSMKKINGKPARPGELGRPGGEVWKQEIWVMYQLRSEAISNFQFLTRLPVGQVSNKIQNQKSKNLESNQLTKLSSKKLKVISAWRYPGVSPKRNPIPEDILRELEEGIIMETDSETL